MAVLNLVGLCKRALGDRTPHLNQFIKQNGGGLQVIDPVVPAVTCSAQATYLTGKNQTSMELWEMDGMTAPLMNTIFGNNPIA